MINLREIRNFAQLIVQVLEVDARYCEHRMRQNINSAFKMSIGLIDEEANNAGSVDEKPMVA